MGEVKMKKKQLKSIVSQLQALHEQLKSKRIYDEDAEMFLKMAIIEIDSIHRMMHLCKLNDTKDLK